MKMLVLVDGVASIPEKVRREVFVVNANNWSEAVLFFQGKTEGRMFWEASCPVVRLLKLVEDFEGNLAVYTTQQVDEVMRSRFSRLSNRCRVTIKDGFGKPSEWESVVSRFKEKVA
jgi:hypothetical protein